jgi:hypothetical protein
MEELVASVGCGRKKEKPSARSKNEELAEEREKFVVAPLDVRWLASGYAIDLWWSWWWTSR